jgi:hypothetical protein
MSEAVAVAEHEVTTTTDTKELRVSLTEAELRDIRGGHILLVAGSEFDLQDDSDDMLVYADTRPGATQFNGYKLDETGATTDWFNGISNTRIVKHVSRDYDTWRKDYQWARATGKLANVNPGYLPQTFRNEVQATGRTMPRYATYVEVLTVENEVVTARVFTTQSETPDAVEYGTMTALVADLPALQLIDRERFNRQFGLAKDVWPLGSLWNYEGELYIATAHRGSRATFTVADENTGLAKPKGETKDLTVEYSSYVSRVAVDSAAYVATLPTEAVRDALNLLSRNTVTRALKHADSNDYCKETAVALTSAGHTMPEIRVKGTITIEVDFSTKEYMFLRKAFGLANENVDNLDAVLKQNYRRLSSESRGALPDMTPNEKTKFDLHAEVEWKTPKLRPLQ